MRKFIFCIILLRLCLISDKVLAQKHSFLFRPALNEVNATPTLSPVSLPVFSKKVPDSAVKKGRIWLVAGVQTAIWAGSFIALNKVWYADYPKTHFHFFNDWDEWGKMDKLGHLWTAYSIGRVTGAMWKWTGINQKTAVWLGGASALAYQSIVEILDGYSSQWGFSMGDMTADIVGTSAYVAQELLWKEQKLQIKFSYWAYGYPPDQVERSNDLFGTNSLERILKDYNSQTYWLSANLRSFLPKSNLPKWLNASFGYNSRVMLGASSNIYKDKDGNVIDRSDVQRYRRLFLAPDIDLTKIKTRSKFLKSTFFLLNMIKVPLPTLEYDTRGKFIFHPIYF